MFNLGKLTLRSALTRPETFCYPFESRDAIKESKGLVDIDITSCIFCGICQKRCPCSAIEVVKADQSWSINRFTCVQCGHCVRECPKSCLSMKELRPEISREKARTSVQKSRESYSGKETNCKNADTLETSNSQE